MPDEDESEKKNDRLDDAALRARLEELKARVASLDERIDALEKRKRDTGGESTPSRS
jgi:hypothetical protein